MTDMMKSLIAVEEAVSRMVTSSMEGSRMVDPMDQYLGPDGRVWEPLGSGLEAASLFETNAPYQDAVGQNMIRRICRHFAKDNPFAINGHENRISYIVGSGHTYKAVDKDPDNPATEEQKQAVQKVVDGFLKVNKWQKRQQENVRRLDRDGENILRIFPNSEDGFPRVRYVEPGAVFTPKEHAEKRNFTFGIETDPDDWEEVLTFFINEQPVDASEIQHRKRGAMDAKRGVPIAWSVRNNLYRALKILRNGSTVTEVQTAIGMIRRFTQASKATVSAWLSAKNDKVNPPLDGAEPTTPENTKLQDRFDPGSILNVPQNIEYEFPGIKIDPSKYIESLQAELRAIAAAWVMPEFMLTAKTDDTSRAAAFTAESPSVKNFERLQWDEIEADIELIEMALQAAVDLNKGLVQSDLDKVAVEAQPPELQVRDRLKEAQRRETEIRSEVLSVQTARAESGRDDQQEQNNIDEHRERTGGVPTGERPDDFLKDEKDEDDESDNEPDSGKDNPPSD